MKKWYIKERINPQLKKAYFVGYGRLTKKQAEEIVTSTLYGLNIMRIYGSKNEYQAALIELNAREVGR